MPRKINQLEAVAILGIDIGKNTFHLVGFDSKGAIVLRQSFHAAKSRLGSRTCRLASSVWRRASEHIISAGNSKGTVTTHG